MGWLGQVDDDSPDRCISMRKGSEKRCNNPVVPGARSCSLHGGHAVAKLAREAELNMYRLGKWTARVNELARHSGVRTIDQEIGILRVILEETIKKCDTEIDLMLYSDKLSNIINDIRACVQLSDKLATKSELLIGRGETLAIGQKIIDILGSKITDESLLLEIAEEISAAFLTPVNGPAAIESVEHLA